MHGHHIHPYALQAAAFCAALVFPAALVSFMTAGRLFERFKRSRKPYVRFLPSSD